MVEPTFDTTQVLLQLIGLLVMCWADNPVTPPACGISAL
jgi:hypothetical protein